MSAAASITPVTPRSRKCGRSWSRRARRKRRNGTISNGREPRCFSIVGNVVSVSCT
jgi:hypothetical protein